MGCLIHKYGKWSKLSKGFKSRRCSKCCKTQKKRETLTIKYRYPELYALLRDDRFNWDDEL